MDPDISLCYESLVEGTAYDREYAITPEVLRGFLAAFGDRSPIHVNPDYAKARGFADSVMHGGILNGFLSHFVGMVMPGERSLLLSADLRYTNPSYLGDVVCLSAKIAQKLDSQNVVVLHVVFFNRTRGYNAASGRVQVKIRPS